MLTGVSTVAWADEPSNTSTVTFNIPQQAADRALTLFAEQADLTLIFPPELVDDKEANELIGTYTHEEGAKILLDGTGLAPSFSNEVVMNVTIDDTSTRGENAMNATKKVGLFAIIAGALSGGVDAQESAEEAAQTEARPAQPTISQQRDSEEIRKDEEAAKAKRGLAEFVVIDEIVVRGKNVGVRRFEDDAQPYVIFNSDDIATSPVTTLEDFLRTRLPQNTQVESSRQFNEGAGSTAGNLSSVNLRGLGAEQTLILVNGRRIAQVSLGNDFRQPDINGIPLGLVERIEVLPATASGIYGGGATGGVINIITRRDYVGGEISFNYGNAFDTDVADRRVEGSFGFNLEDGRTSVLFSASVSDQNDMLAGDRPFAQRSRDLLFLNMPPDASASVFGSTANFRSLSGDLVLDDGRSLGAANTFVPIGYFGISSDGGQALIDNAGQYNLALPESYDGLGQRIIQSPETQSFTVNVRREFTPWLELFADAMFFENKGQSISGELPRSVTFAADDPGNPFQDRVNVTYPSIGPAFESQFTSETAQYIAGFTAKLPHNWTATGEYNWSRSRFEGVSTSPAFNRFQVEDAIQAGELDVLRDTAEFPLDLSPFALPSPNNFDGPRDNILTNYALRASGPLFELPAGPINISALMERRESEIEPSFSEGIDFFTVFLGGDETTITYTPAREQRTDSVYAEALIPLFSEKNAIPFVKELDLQISTRYDAYRTESPSSLEELTVESRQLSAEERMLIGEIETAVNEFSSWDYTIGARWVVSDDVLFRASYGTGFLPPGVQQIFPIVSEPGFSFFADPKRENVFGPQFFDRITFVGNPNLDPEESDSTSIGVVLTPQFIPGFRFSVDYSLIEKTDEIANISNVDLFNLEDQLPGRIVRAELTQEDIDQGFTGGAIISIDASPLNLANTKSEAWDFQLDQLFETEKYGAFNAFVVATLMTRLEARVLPDSDVRDSIGFRNGPLKWRLNGGLIWDSPSREFSAGWNFQYYDDYLIYNDTDVDFQVDAAIERQGTDSIDSEIYHDVNLTYRPSFPGLWGGILDGTEVRLGIQNLFNQAPATFAASSGLATRGSFSPYGDVRLRRYTVALRKTF